jgi:hypothetical protein
MMGLAPNGLRFSCRRGAAKRVKDTVLFVKRDFGPFVPYQSGRLAWRTS